MSNIYKTTTSLCPRCAKDTPARYEERDDGMYMVLQCEEHGAYTERVESDAAFFKQGYELEYAKRPAQLLIPITYRCNINCRYCYSISNKPGFQPPDRPIEQVIEAVDAWPGNVTFIGGEPTARADLAEILEKAKRLARPRRFDIATNAQRLADLDYTLGLKEAGLDFVFFSFNDINYEENETIYEKKLIALENCRRAGLPIWLQRTVEDLVQIDTIWPFLEQYKTSVFKTTLRTIRPYGIKPPPDRVFVSDIVKYLGREHDWAPGATPFNRTVEIKGRNVKISSWVSDVERLDPIDYQYLISDDRIMSFHRGMRTDEVLLRRYASQAGLNVERA